MPEEYRIADLASSPAGVGAMLTPMPQDTFGKGILFISRVNELLTLLNQIVPNILAARAMLKPQGVINLDNLGGAPADGHGGPAQPEGSDQAPAGTSPQLAQLAGNINLLKAQAGPMLAVLKEKAGDMKVKDLVEEFNQNPQALISRLRGG